MATILAVDTSSDMDYSEYSEKQIVRIPLAVTFGNETYDKIDKDEFFDKLIKSDDFPTTSQPSPQVFLDLFNSAKESNDSVVLLLISSALSGTYQNAVMAKNMVDYDEIYIIDSGSATTALKLLIDHAVKLRDQGCSAKEIAAKLESLKKRTKVIAIMDTLEYLAKGGRLSKTVANIGALVNIKPLITLVPDDGVQIVAKSIGRNRAISSLIKEFEQHLPDHSFPILPIYSYDPTNCNAMIARFQKQFPDINFVPQMQIGATIGTHIGPNAFGLSYIEQE